MQKNNHKKMMEIIGHRLYVLRTFHKMKQSELGKRLGCSQNYISDWEAGRRWIPTKYLIELSRLFNISLAHFNPDENPHIQKVVLVQTPGNIMSDIDDSV